MNEEKLREAFLKIKEEMNSLQHEIDEIKQYLQDLHAYLTQSTPSTHTPAYPQHSSTQSQEINRIKPQLSISTRNDGVPADSQQTFDTSNIQENIQNTHKNLNLRDMKKLINSLQQDLKTKFNSLSRQEFYIFSLIYNLDIQGQKPDYKTIAIMAGLTESSVRDYISRLIHRGIPIKKEKINNKQIIISIPEELKSLATLDSLTKISQYNQENDQNLE